jgi:hypothetical protein
MKAENDYSILPPNLIPLSEVGTTCFSSCCDKDSAFIFTTWKLETKLEWVLTIANASRSTDELEIINFGHPS